MKLSILFAIVAAVSADVSSDERFLQEEATFVSLSVCTMTICAANSYCTEPKPDFAVCVSNDCRDVVCPDEQVCVGKEVGVYKCIDNPCLTPFALETCPDLCRVNDFEEVAYCQGVGKIEEPPVDEFTEVEITCISTRCSPDTICVDLPTGPACVGGIDAWFDVAKENYAGDLRVKTCLKRQDGRKPVPKDGDSCSMKSKACFFGNQICGDLPYPDTLCECVNENWTCDEALVCPSE